MTLSPGTRLGPYEILSPLGAGGMGEVYQAKDTRLDRDVAIKVLPDELFGDADHVARFEREAKALAALSHPGIAAIHSFEEVDKRHLLVQELLEGDTLRHLLGSGRLPLRKTLDYAVQIVMALAAAHEKGVVHRDLKPENLFVTSDGRVKILDFGLAKLTRQQEDASGPTDVPTVSRHTQPGAVLGTLSYMSPEQVRGKAADRRSDIFSFGSVLYEMLSGKKAFRGDSAADTMSAILKEDPPDLIASNRSIPPALERIVHHCLEKSPEQRFQSARDLAFDLESVSSVSTTSAARAFTRFRFRPTPSRAATLAAAVALGAGLLAGWLAFHAPPLELPRFKRLTYRRGPIWGARFAPDGHTIVCTASWGDARVPQLHSLRVESAESTRLNLPDREVRSISHSGEMLLFERKRAHNVSGYLVTGTLSQASIAGTAVRDLAEDVADASWAPDGTTFAVVRAPDWHYRLELPAGTTLCETKGWMSHPRVSPNGDLLAFVEHPDIAFDGGSVAVVDRAGRKRSLSAGWDSVQGLAFSPGGDEVWFTAGSTANTKSLHAVSLSGRHRALIATPAGMMLEDVSRDGNVLFVERNSRLGLLAMLPDQAGARDVSALDWAVDPLLSHDGKTLVFTEGSAGSRGGSSIYMRRLDRGPSEPAVRLGEGEAGAISPDGRLVVRKFGGSPLPALQLIPTGAGEPKPIDLGQLEVGYQADFTPDGKQLLISAHERGRPDRLYAIDLPDGTPRAIAPEGINPLLIAADGRALVIESDGRPALYPLNGGAIQPIAGVEAGDQPLAWAEDGKSLYVSVGPPSGARVVRIDGRSGRRETWKEYTPGDTAGLAYMRAAAISADGKTVIVHYQTVTSTLYLAEGIH